MIKRITIFAVFAISVATGPAAVIFFLRAAFRGLDWPWYFCVPFVLAMVVWAYGANWALGYMTDRRRDEAKERLRDEVIS